MKGKKRNNSYVTIIFVIGLILYLVGLFLLFGTSFSRVVFLKNLLNINNLTGNTIFNLKICGITLSVIGFLLFIISVVCLYKNDSIKENNRELIVEGKADVVTIIVMTYVLIFMLVICLFFDEMVGALLFGIAVVVQSILNTILIKYFNKNT